jgi:hypothetical protein
MRAHDTETSSLVHQPTPHHSTTTTTTTTTATTSCNLDLLFRFLGNTPRQRALFVQTLSVPLLLTGAVWVWSDAAALPRVPGLASSVDLERQRSASTTLGWMFLFESLGQLNLIVASHRHVLAEEVSRGTFASLPTTTGDTLPQGRDIHVDFHHWMKSEDSIKKWSSFVSYLCFIVLVSLCRFDIAGQALDADILGSRHSTVLLTGILGLFGPQLLSAACYVGTGTWPCPWYGALIFLMCPFVSGLAMFWRYANGVDRVSDHAFWGALVLLLYMGPFMVYTLGEPYVERWHMEGMSLVVWLLLAVVGRGMML